MDSGKLDNGAETEKDEKSDEWNAGAQTGARASVMPTWTSRVLTRNYIVEGRKSPRFDIPFLMLTILILVIGVIMVLSASFARAYYTTGQPMLFFSRQLVFALSGIAIMLIVSHIKVKTISRVSIYAMLVSIFLLVLVLNVGVKVNGARRWIGIGTGNFANTFQPSEIAKLSVVLCYAQMACKFGGRMKTFKYGVAPFAAITAIIIGLLWFEPHLSAIVIIGVLSVIMMFAAGTRLRWFAIAGLVLALAAGLLFFTAMRRQSGSGGGEPGQSVTVTQIVQENAGSLGYAGSRISAWLDPDADPLGSGLQIRQSLFAVGSGGAFGQGLGRSRQKYLYLPEEHNDYIFAIVCEELGYIGALLILLLFALLIIRGFWIAMHAVDKYSSLITIGITSLLAIQVFLNVAVVTNLLPATGISLPFFSYGGTALWIQLLQMGIILAVSREIPEPADEKARAKRVAASEGQEAQ